MSAPAVRRRVAVALGANLGRRRTTLERAVAALRASDGLEVESVSSWHETAPVGGPPGQPPYRNGALVGWSTRSARELLQLLQGIERQLGRRREREVRNGPRAIDLDLLLLGDVRVDEPDLQVPHPRLLERRFVLAPLAEIAPDLVLPGGTTARAALAALGDAAARSG